MLVWISALNVMPSRARRTELGRWQVNHSAVRTEDYPDCRRGPDSDERIAVWRRWVNTSRERNNLVQLSRMRG